MASTSLRLSIRPDPDIREACEGIITPIKQGYDHGMISWDRRLEMLADPFALVTIRNYDARSDDPGAVILGFFVEPSAAFLAEIEMTATG